MNCSRVREAFLKGVVLPPELVQAHLDACPQCRELFEHDAALGRALATQAAQPVAFPSDLFDQLDARLARETGLRAWLRSRPSAIRFQLIALSVILVVVVGGVHRVRPDFAEYPLLRQILLLGGYFLAILIATGKELSLSARRGALADHLGLLLGALGVPLLFAFLPATEASRHLGPEGALSCFAYGGLLTLPIALLFWAFDRDDRPAFRTVCFSTVVLGLSANLVLELHCASGNALHLLLGHASVGMAWLAAWSVARRLSRA